MTRAGGKRPGAGRKKGSKSPQTLEREEVLRQFRQRAMRSADLLFDAQMTLARGQTFLYRIDKEWIKTGVSKNGEEKGWWKSKKPVLVTDKDEIQEYLTNKDEGDNENEEGSSYYFLTAKEPNNQAIDSILDRSLGKPTQPIGGEDGKPIAVAITGMKIIKE